MNLATLKIIQKYFLFTYITQKYILDLDRTLDLVALILTEFI